MWGAPAAVSLERHRHGAEEPHPRPLLVRTGRGELGPYRPRFARVANRTASSFVRVNA